MVFLKKALHSRVLTRKAFSLVLGGVILAGLPMVGSMLDPVLGANQAFSYQANAQAYRPKKTDLSNHRTYIVNGLASAVPTIGYGLRNLHKRLGGEYYAYMTPIEAGGAEYQILKAIKREYRKNPNININLIGVSYGGNIVTWVASRLAYQRIPVNYLAVIDAPAPSAISTNVHRVDNFVCRVIGCIGARLRLARGNKSTILNQFTYRVPHIRLPNNKKLHQRIVRQLTVTPMFTADDFVAPDPEAVGVQSNTGEGFVNNRQPGNTLQSGNGQQRVIKRGYLPEGGQQQNQLQVPGQPANVGANAPVDLMSQ